jgi:hypothetical protein
MIMIARYTIRPLDTRTWDALTGRWTSTTARVRRRRLVHLVSSAHRDEQQRRRRAGVQGTPVREGKAHAALVSDGDLAVAWRQSGAVAGRARRQLAEIDQIVPPRAAR